MFELEALKARHGDCLLLHWGTAEDPRIALVDGGPDQTYANSLKPRLVELARRRSDGTLPIDLMMVSHIDDDHIAGLLQLADELEAGATFARVKRLWFNSLEGLLDDKLPKSREGTTASVGGAWPGSAADEWDRKVLASVPQGQRLDVFAKHSGLDATMNRPYRPLVLLGAKPRTAAIAGLSLTPVAPTWEAVENLRVAWAKNRNDGIVAAYSDRSPYNLSSIVVIAEHVGRRMLLTGDALGSHIIDGLAALGEVRDGRAHFDLLKLPHHGSQNNVKPEFFEAITADHYVVSGDHVKFPNPHEHSMRWLAAARGDEAYTVWCTYELDYMRRIFGDRLRTPGDGELGVAVSLA